MNRVELGVAQEKPVLGNVRLHLLAALKGSFGSAARVFAGAASRAGCVGLLSELAGVQQRPVRGALQITAVLQHRHQL